MADREAADHDLFKTWLGSSQSFFAANPASQMPEPLREKCAGLFAAWNQFAQTYAKAGLAAPDTAKMAGGPFDPVGWLDTAGDSGFGDLWRWFGGPEHVDPLRQQRDALTASEQWRAYATSLERYRAVMGAAWLQAFKRFADQMASGRETSIGLPDWETIQAAWQQAADAELAAAQRSDAFLDAQRDLIRARLDCSALLRGHVERFAETLGLPTRAELDAMQQTLHALQRELRSLRAQTAGDP